MRTVVRPWGTFQIIYQTHNYWTKILTVNPGESLSLQYHEKRFEFWTPLAEGLTGVINGTTVDLVPGTRYDVPRFVLHRISNHGTVPVSLIEVATGVPDEKDIVRVNDKYGR